jgi:hypothetical protein
MIDPWALPRGLPNGQPPIRITRSPAHGNLRRGRDSGTSLDLLDRKLKTPRGFSNEDAITLQLINLSHLYLDTFTSLDLNRYCFARP